MTVFFSQLINGLSLGSLYALIALGYSMVYGIILLLNFAHGDIIMVGAYMSWFVMNQLGLGPVTAVLALNIYHQRATLKEYFLPVLAGGLAGTPGRVGSVPAPCRPFPLGGGVTAPLLPQSGPPPPAGGPSSPGQAGPPPAPGGGPRRASKEGRRHKGACRWAGTRWHPGPSGPGCRSRAGPTARRRPSARSASAGLWDP